MSSLTRTFARRSLFLANAVSLILGMVAVIGAAATSEQPILATTLNLVGGAFVSASVVTLILGAMTAREASAQVDSAVLRGLQDVLTPIRDPLYGSALAAYRYDCHLLCPAPGDSEPDYLYQSIRISYRVEELPAALRVVCAASRDDRALEGLEAEDYILRWMVDDNLDVGDGRIFSFGGIRIDGIEVTSGNVEFRPIAGGRARIERFPVPRALRGTVGHTVEFSFTARKYVGSDRRIRIQAQLFRHVTDAEYRLTVDPALRLSRLHVSASEVSALGVAQGASVRALYPEPFDRHAAIAQLPFPLQPGSTIAFQLDREVIPAQAPATT